MENITHLIGTSRKKLLDLVKARGEVTVHQAAEVLDLAPTTVRQHFARLEGDGLVEGTSRSEGPGRPTIYFRITDTARGMYPSSDSAMLSELLDFLSHQGYHRVIDDFFRNYWQRRRDELRTRLDEANALSLTERLDVLHAFLDDQGFMPRITVTDDGSVEIRECNCPLRGCVESTRLPCRLEAEFLEQVVDQPLTRADYIPDGHSACVYQFSSGDDN